MYGIWEDDSDEDNAEFVNELNSKSVFKLNSILKRSFVDSWSLFSN